VDGIYNGLLVKPFTAENIKIQVSGIIIGVHSQSTGRDQLNSGNAGLYALAKARNDRLTITDHANVISELLQKRCHDFQVKQLCIAALGCKHHVLSIIFNSIYMDVFVCGFSHQYFFLSANKKASPAVRGTGIQIWQLD
jgi:hypothetical protein